MATGVYERLLRPLLFGLDPEAAHRLSIACCDVAGRCRPITTALARRCLVDDPALRVRAAGLDFPNPLGLAAGYDKNGRAVPLLSSLGFGHVEIGSVSARPSAGNRSPRLFRLPRDRGIVVNYGLPNDGAEAVAGRLRGRQFAVPVGVNIVSTNDAARPATEDTILEDYGISLEAFRGCADYFCLNLSCPNTPDGRGFFDDTSRLHRLDRLLSHVAERRPKAPVFLKMKPTQDEGYLREFLSVVRRYDFVAGLQINLPPGKPAGLRTTASPKALARMPGAVAGKPVEGIINAALASLYRLLGPGSELSLVAAGGVFDADDAYRKIRLGASLVQLYTGLVYRGPALVGEVLRGLARLVRRDGYGNIAQAVGADVR